MIKKNVKRILVLLITSIIMVNFIFSSTSNATSSNTVSSGTKQNQDELKTAQGMDASVVLDGLVGVFTYFEKVKVVILGGVFQYLGTIVGESAGTTYTSSSTTIITPEDILFNKLAITDINFFNISSFGFGSQQKVLSSDSPIKVLKQNVATWYMTLRTVAIIILAAILIYIGIRMATSSLADDKTKYKKMFMNWLVSFAMVFLLHYIIIAVININNTLVEIISNVNTQVSTNLSGEKETWFSNYITQLVADSFMTVSAIYGWSSAIVYLCIVALTLIFLIMYIKRMIVIAFLVLISPLITITYSIDKAGDGSAQAFSNWFRKFLENVLIQPFHCIIYMAFVSVGINLLNTTHSLASAVLVILTMFFILQAEEIVKNIFEINAKETGSGLAAAAVLSNAYGKLSAVGGKATKAATNGKTALTTAKARANASSNVAVNNIAASTGTNNISGNRQAPASNAKNLNTKSSNTELSEKMSGTANADAYVADYAYLVDDEPMDVGSKNNVNGNIDVQASNQEAELSTKQAENEAFDKNENKTNVPQSRWKKAGTMVAKGIIKGNKVTSGMAGAVMGGTLAGVAGGNMVQTAGAILVGNKIQKQAEEYAVDQYKDKKAKIKEYLANRDKRQKENELKESFKDYKNGVKINRNADIQSARQYLNMTPDKVNEIKNTSERQYVESLHAMREAYEKDNYDEDSGERVIQTMENIIDEESDVGNKVNIMENRRNIENEVEIDDRKDTESKINTNNNANVNKADNTNNNPNKQGNVDVNKIFNNLMDDTKNYD